MVEPLFKLKTVRITLRIAGISVVVALGLFAKNYYNAIDEYYSEFGVSKSIADAKQSKVFVRELDIQPVEIWWRDQRIKFLDAWIEEASKIKYRWFFFEQRIHLGEYRACFTVDNIEPFWFKVNQPEEPPRFFKEGKGSSSEVKSWAGENHFVFCEDLDTDKPAPFRMSLTNDFRGERKNDILISPR